MGHKCFRLLSLLKSSICVCLAANILFFISCGSEEQPVKPIDHQKLKEQFIKANQHNLQRERDIIEQYIKNHLQPYRYTSKGIYIYMVKSSEKGDSIRAGDRLEVDYKIFLLDGTLCYQSEGGKPQVILVEKDHTESGIHRGLQMMKKGDRARMIIPSYLAHGLLGDLDKIPPQSPILVDISVRQ
ncbi:MAG: FKBP-type peptidyl-prolyl cis-trans isomerase [Bacteroidia bacterium]|nr:FKBP-type peptidyl-prolyl cis-trans isomerase [Bacteroidia bacterium]